MTVAEYFETPETVLPSELVYGTMRVAEAPAVSHQRVVRDVAFALLEFVRPRHLGEVMLAPVDVVLDLDAALVIQPDVLFVSSERAHLVTDKVYGAPDLVVEVLSPNPRIGQLEERLAWFAKYGVRECWLMRLPNRQIEVLSLKDGAIVDRRTFSRFQPIASAVLGGLSLTPSGVFGW